MKKLKYICLAFFFSILAVSFSACSNVNPSLKFNDEVISLVPGQEYSLNDKVELKNISFNDITFVSGNSQIALIENNVVKAKEYGTTNILAKSTSGTLGAITVKVLGKFSTPKGITFDGETHSVKWDKVYSEDSDGIFFARGYTLLLTKNGGEAKEINVDNNCYVVKEEGTYSIKVKALGSGRIQDSNYSESYTFAYGKVSGISNISYNVETGMLEWTKIENAKYRVKVNGLLYPETTTNSQKLEIVNAGKYNISVIAYDSVNPTKVPSESHAITLTKLPSPNLRLKYEINDGQLVWDSAVDRTFLVEYSGVTSGSFTTSKKVSTLENLSPGLYQINVTAIGSTDEISSNPSNTVLVRKLPSATITFLNSSTVSGKETINVSLSSILNESYPFKLTITSPSGISNVAIFNITGTQDAEFDLTGFNDEYGIYTVTASVVAKNSNEVNGDNSLALKIVRLKSVTNVKNSLSEGKLNLSFNKVENADTYKVKINNVPVEYTIVEETQDSISCQIDVSAMTFATSFDITIISSSTEPCIENVYTKTVNILGHTSEIIKTPSGFTFSQVGNATGYMYQIYKSDKNYTRSELLTSNTINTNSLDIDLPFGYYEIRVYSLGNDDTHIDSLNHAQKRFSIEEKLITPTANFLKVGDSYKLEITSVANATKYQIYLDDVSLKNDDSINYFFIPKFEEVKDYTIKVIAHSDDEVILPSSEPLTITLTRLDVFTSYVVENEHLKIAKHENAKKIKALVISDGEVKEFEGDMDFDLSTYSNNFIVQVGFIGKDTIDNHYYLDSQYKEIEFLRMQAPYELKFVDNVISFKNNQDNDNYMLTITVNTLNGSVTNQISLPTDVIYNKETSGIVSNYRVDFNRLIDFASLNSDFKTAYQNRTSVKVELQSIKVGLDSGIYYLNSYKAKTVGNQEFINLDTLNTVDVTFDYLTNTLNFGTYIDGTTFEISVIDSENNVEKIISDVSSYYIGDILEANKSKTFSVVAMHPSKINSKTSKTVTIKKLGAVSNIIIKKEGFSFILPDEADFDHVELNGVSINKENTVSYSNISEYNIIFLSSGSVKVDLNGNKTYLANSDVSKFTLKDMLDSTNGTIADKKITWQAPNLTDFINGTLVTPPLKYVVNFYNGETLVLSTINQQENSLSLFDEQLDKLASGEYRFEVIANLDEYSLVNNGTGYKGSCVCYSGNIIKEAKITDASLSQEIKATLEEEKQKDVIISFTGSYNANIKFDVYLNDTLVTTTYTVDTNKYLIDISTVKQQLVGDFKIKIFAYTDSTIVSEGFEIIGYRNYKAVDAELNNDFVLNILSNPIAKNGYLVKLTYNESVQDIVVNSTSFNMAEILNNINAEGEITLDVLTKGDGINELSSLDTFTKKFFILHTPTITLNKNGFTLSSVDSGVNYYLTIKKGDEKIIDDIILEEPSYTYPNDLLGQYTIMVRTKKPNCNNSRFSQKDVSIVRLDSVSGLNFTRDATNKRAINLSFVPVANATSYLFSIIDTQTNEEIVKDYSTTATTFSLSDILGDAVLVDGKTYNINVIAVALESGDNLNSVVSQFTFSVQNNTVKNFKILDNNRISFEDDSVGKYLVIYNNGTSEEFVEVSGSSPFVVKLNVIDITKTIVEIIKLGNITSSGISTGIVLDSNPKKNDVFKLDKANVTVDEYGDGIITYTPVDSPVEFYAKTDSSFVKVDTLTFNNLIKFNLKDLMSKLLITGVGEKSISFEVRAKNYISSDLFTLTFNTYEFGQLSKIKDASYENDYICIADDSGKNKLYIIEVYNDLDLVKRIKFMQSDLTTVDNKLAFDITSLLNDSEYNFQDITYKVRFNSCYLEGVANVSYYSEFISYTKLKSVGKVSVLSEGEISWTETNPDASGYLVYFQKKNNLSEVYKFYVEANNKTKFDATLELGASTDAYYCYVRAVSTSTDYVTSAPVYILDGTGAYKDVYKVSAPTDISIDDEGNLGFLVDNFDILEVGDPTGLLRSIMVKPFSYNVNNFANITVTLKFVSNQATYTIRIPAYKLVRLSDTALQRLNEINIPELNNIKQYARTYNSGAFNYNTFFDEYGESIPAGEYKVYIKQNTYMNELDANTDVWLNSSYNVNPVTVYVSNSPELLTYREEVNGEQIYYLSFNTVEIKADVNRYVQATDYILYFDKNHIFNIRQIGEIWNLSRFGSADASPIELTVRDNRIFIKISRADDGLYDALIDVGEYRNVQIYAKGNIYTVNGKTTVVSVKLLTSPRVNVIEGEFQIVQVSNSASIKIEYSRTNGGVKESLNYASLEKWSMDDMTAGLYYDLSFRYSGRISKYSMDVDGPKTLIGTVKKLDAPQVETNFGDFMISDVNSTGVSKYRLYNNVNSEIVVKIEKDASNKTIYEAGFNEEDIYSQEASIFYFISQGTLEAMNISAPIDNNVRFYINSQPKTVNAFMLDTIKNFKIDSKGVIRWDAVTGKNGNSVIVGDYEVFYRILITRFTKTNTGSSESLTPAETYEFYTNKNNYDFSNITLNGVFDITIQAFSARAISGTSSSEIKTTLENQNIISNNLQISDEFILKGARKSASNLIRLEGIQDLTIENGELVWANNSEYSQESRYYLTFTSGEVIKEDIVNETKWWENNINLNERELYSVNVYSVPKHEISLEAEETLNGRYIRSKETSYISPDGNVSVVSKLPIPTSNNIHITNSGGMYQTVTWQSYKNDISVADDSKYNYFYKYKFNGDVNGYQNPNITNMKEYNVYINGVDNPRAEIDGETLNIYLGKHVINNYLQVIPKDDNYGKLKSTAYEFDLQAPDGLATDITYNNELQRFEWEAPQEENMVYVVTTFAYVNGEYVAERIYTTDTPYFEPVVTGQRMTIEVALRKGNSVSSENLDSQGKRALDIIDYNIFGSGANAGEGNQNKPYTISSITQLQNIRFRQSKGAYLKRYIDVATQTIVEEEERFYFRQNANLSTLNGFNSNYMNFDFGGIYDGNGFTMNISHAVKYINVDGGEQVEKINGTFYRYYQSLFRSVSGKITNLNIVYAPTGAASGYNLILSPLAVRNTGIIENCNLVSMDISKITIYPQLLIAGFVAENMGQITNCINGTESSSIRIGLTASGKKVTYAGITANNLGALAIIQDCINYTSVTVSATTRNNEFNVSGITFNNDQGVILKSINYGDITAATPEVTSLIAGVAYYITNGAKVALSANIGLVSGSDNSSGGIVYSITGRATRMDYCVALGAVNNQNKYALYNKVESATGTGNYAQMVSVSSGISFTQFSENSSFSYNASYNGQSYKVNVVYSNGKYSVNFN